MYVNAFDYLKNHLIIYANYMRVDKLYLGFYSVFNALIVMYNCKKQLPIVLQIPII